MASVETMDSKSRRMSIKIILTGMVLLSLVLIGGIITLIAVVNLRRGMEDEVQITLPKQIRKLEVIVDHYKADMEFAAQNPEPEKFDIEIGGEHFDKRSNALEAIVQQKSRLKDNELLPIGTYRGFRLYLYQEGVGQIRNLCLTVKHNLGYRVEIDPSTCIGNLVRLNNVISHDIPKKHKEAVEDLTKLKKRLESAKAEMTTTPTGSRPHARDA